jgi:WD40 repeat protein/predicted Ser/Thr protein kinase
MTGVCPDCGTPLPKDAALMGLCPQCLLSMALEDEESPTLHGSSPGGILGERYQIREVLGRGGMGEVYRAFDLKLRVDVALKAVRPELSSSEKARDLLRQEVRSAREVVSPNVCRIFDLVVEEGRELVSMEYIDGTTLAETLRERGPLELQEAREIAAQFLSGLEAIHEAGLVHRDFKPENVMLTRAGRVVVMDFGLAKARSEGKSRTIAGTPAYMSPEQSRGEPVDARSDVFSAGVVLTEMLWDGPRGTLWDAVRETPPRVPDGPWALVLRQALASDRESRHATARALARALDEVTHRLPGFEDKHPYPGLASFTQEDAGYFFGREMEVEAVWKKLKRPRLLALIGPSGAGKSSFLRAGLLPTLPAGWRVILSTPGNRPFQSLAQALLPAFAGDMEAIQSFLGFERDTAVPLLSKWRQKSEHALVIVDQFEELFTLNPPEVQEAFSTLLGRIVLEADVHVLLSLRDDFLLHCQKHDALGPVFSELTPLGTLSPSALRRALVQPALACGYRFEDEALVEEMVTEVSHERGVLPLLAFAASRLWEKRDREKGLLTREAYQEIGGVGGALAQHAEETLSRIGEERTHLVRELFRNLVTAQGTRASRELEELLSIFPKEEERKAAEEVLRELVAARLLTSYETSVEIIHESLLSAWPRLVQWRNQDEGGALLRDQLRQAAQAWQDRGRPDDLLWTGKSYRELSLWRESYTGGLSSTEEAFAQAAAKFAGRRRRRRQIAVAASFALLLGVVGVVTSLWRRSVLEVSRREAAQILALGRVELQDRPTAALAHALASLERADNEPARRFAVEALWRGAAAFVLPKDQQSVDFSPDGHWLATGGLLSGVRLWSGEGGPFVTVGAPDGVPGVQFSPGSDFLAAGMQATARFWSIPEGSELRNVELGGNKIFMRRGSHLFSSTPTSERTMALRDWSILEGVPDVLALHDLRDVTDWDIEGSGEWLVTARAQGVYVTPLRDPSRERSRLVGKHEAKVVWVASQQTASRIVSSDETGEVRIWTFSDTSAELERTLHAPAPQAILDPTGSWLVVAPGGAQTTGDVAYVWDLKGPPDAEALALRNSSVTFLNGRAIDPQGLWLATANDLFGVLWPLHPQYSRVLRAQSGFWTIAFAADGKSLLSTAADGTVRLWPLSPRGDEKHRVLMSTMSLGLDLDVDPAGRYALVAAGGRVFVAPLQSGEPREMPGFGNWVNSLAFSVDGRLAAAAFIRPEALIRVWDLDSGAIRVLDPRLGHEDCDWEGGWETIRDVEFLPDGRLLTGGSTGVRLWELESGKSQEVRPCANRVERRVAVSGDGGTLLVMESNLETRVSTLSVHDLHTGSFRDIASHGNRLNAVALDPTGTIAVTGDLDGVVRVGPITGAEPHLLFGHELQISSVAVSPDSRWIASASQDGTIRLWPMPDGTPFHALPYAEILERLQGLTNLRVVPDDKSDTGYRVEVGPFPGWKKLPEW